MTRRHDISSSLRTGSCPRTWYACDARTFRDVAKVRIPLQFHMCTLRAIAGRHHVLRPFVVFRRTDDVDECGPCIWVAPSSSISVCLFQASLDVNTQLNVNTQFDVLTQHNSSRSSLNNAIHQTPSNRTLNMSSMAGIPPPPPFRNSLRRPEEVSVPTPLKLRVPRSSMIQ